MYGRLRDLVVASRLRLLLGASLASAVAGFGCSNPLTPDEVRGVYVLSDLRLSVSAPTGSEYRFVADTLVLHGDGTGRSRHVWQLRRPWEESSTTYSDSSHLRYEIDGGVIRTYEDCGRSGCISAGYPVIPRYVLHHEGLLRDGDDGVLIYRRQ